MQRGPQRSMATTRILCLQQPESPRWGVLQNAFLDYVLSSTPPAGVPSGVRQAGLSALDSGTELPEARAQASGPYCGNGVCDTGENCATCAPDCKQVRLLLCGPP